MKALRKKWLLYSIVGLVLIGAGISVSIDAALVRMGLSTIPFISWILYGTSGLVLLNSGICFFGQGVIYRTQMLMKQ